MAEERFMQGEHMQVRLQSLLQQWGAGQATLRSIMGLSEEELYAIASQGYYLFLQGKTAAAKILFEGLLAIDPLNPYYCRALGAIYWREKAIEKALRQFSYAIRLAPADITSYINRAEVYVAQKDFVLAKRDLQHAISHAASYQIALVNKAKAILQMISEP